MKLEPDTHPDDWPQFTVTSPTESLTVIRDVACTLCGCVCDDLAVTVDGQRVVSATGTCELSREFFLNQRTQSNWPAHWRGEPCSREKAFDESLHLLRQSRAPLIYGLSRSSSAGQRAAARLADWLGATIDTTASRCHAPSIVALQQVGESTCSLGEARHHCDLVVFWGSNPIHSHPRHSQRYSIEPTGQFLPGGRADRKVIVVDVKETRTTELADQFVQLPPGRDFDAIWTLRSLVKGLEPASWPEGLDRDSLELLAASMMNCRSGIVYFGLGLTRHGVAHANVESLLRLVTDLNAKTRFYARRMRIPGDVAGADSVLCWQTGFPFSVNLAKGFPRYNPGEYSANDLLERQEVDCCVLVGSEGYRTLSEGAQAYLRQIPTIVLDYPDEPTPLIPDVRFTTSIYGVHTAGTAYRMDEVPIPLRPFLPCGEEASDASVLLEILDRLKG